jgi:hypothetical protein
MKSFKDYLIESKQTYDFKIKLAGEHDDVAKKIKEALSKFDVASCSEAKTTPIQETQVDFPDHKNIGVTLVDVSLNYPATSAEVRALIANAITATESCIRVRNEREVIEEEEINKPETEQVLGKDYDKVNNQKLVGDKGVASFLKELSKNKPTLTQYKGVNDSILAKKAPVEKAVKSEKVAASKSPLSSVSNPRPGK